MQPEARSHDLELQQKPQVSYAENMCLIKMETDAALFFFFFFSPSLREAQGVGHSLLLASQYWSPCQVGQLLKSRHKLFAPYSWGFVSVPIDSKD